MTGRELGNAFSELTDPIDQRERFEAQAAPRPPVTPRRWSSTRTTCGPWSSACRPIGGLGIGVDRLVMLLADVHTIRDVILFPTLRPEQRRGLRDAAAGCRRGTFGVPDGAAQDLQVPGR